MTPQATPVMLRSPSRWSVGRDHLLNAIEILLDPLVLVLSQWAVAAAVEGRMTPQDVILSLVVFSLTFPGPARLTMSTGHAIRSIVISWATLSGLLFLFGYASRYLWDFDSTMLLNWWWASLASLLSAHFLLKAGAPLIRELQGPARGAVIAGINDQGVELARRLRADAYSNVRILGFFDDRARERLKTFEDYSLLGTITDLATYVKTHRVDVIYLSLPMASQKRILALLDDLRDTTSSIYFAPDTFVTDLIQGRMDSVGGMPVVAVCETPFTGMNRVIKRGSDIILTTLILMLISPVMLAIAALIKLTSPGPVIFRQRRYGLDGSEIIVYKFRSMKVMEDGAVIRQAQKDDPRLTRIGRILRRTSLDELPQFFNVLQGRMSIVGPRPHAVAHNEMYRKLIKGYMLRHKVAPGITGWAQVNGFRGETDTLEKMKGRIDHDLEYLRNWSLRLDLYIIVKTVWVIFGGQNAH